MRHLSLGFGQLYGGRLPAGEPPRLDREAVSGSIEWLIELAGRYAVTIFPEDGGPDRSHLMRGWLLARAQQHFERRQHHEPVTAACHLAQGIFFADRRPERGIVIEGASVAFFVERRPGLDEIDRVIEALGNAMAA